MRRTAQRSTTARTEKRGEEEEEAAAAARRNIEWNAVSEWRNERNKHATHTRGPCACVCVCVRRCKVSTKRSSVAFAVLHVLDFVSFEFHSELADERPRDGKRRRLHGFAPSLFASLRLRPSVRPFARSLVSVGIYKLSLKYENVSGLCH